MEIQKLWLKRDKPLEPDYKVFLQCYGPWSGRNRVLYAVGYDRGEASSNAFPFPQIILSCHKQKELIESIPKCTLSALFYWWELF